MALPVQVCCWQHYDKNGVVLPWYTKPFLDVLVTWPLKDWRVFEFGGGYSTIWYAKNAREVVSIDNDQKWVDTIRPQLPSNASIVCATSEEPYLAYIDSLGKFDLIIIDGGFRPQCAPKALEHIKDGGIIVLDNADSFGPHMERMFLYNERHSFPQPRHPDWRTDFWVINERGRWDGMSYEQAAKFEVERLASSPVEPHRVIEQVNRGVGVGGIAFSINK